MTIAGSISAGASFTDSSASDTESATISVGQAVQAAFTDGVGAGQVNVMWQDTRTLLTAGTETLDFAPTSASGKIGVVSLARLKAFYIRASPANTTDLTVSRPASNGVTLVSPASASLAVLVPGGFWAYGNPSATGLATTGADTLTITNGSGASADYTIIIAGGLT